MDMKTVTKEQIVKFIRRNKQEFTEKYGVTRIGLFGSIIRDELTGKYADIAVKTLLNKMVKKGVDRKNIVSKLAGGAAMFGGKNGHQSIGEQNHIAVKKELKKLGVKIVFEETGGNTGRRIDFLCSSGEFNIRMLGNSITE